MDKPKSNLWTRLRCALAAMPERGADTSALIEPLGLLALEQERMAAAARQASLRQRTWSRVVQACQSVAPRVRPRRR
jgi:hypothetical protein